MGMKARRPAGVSALARQFKRAYPALLDILGDEDMVELLLCELPTSKNPPLSKDEAGADDRHVVEWEWGWFCGAAQALGMTRAELYRQLRG